jgi:hypothetical protein
MALIQCNECGKQVSDNASQCPNCGNQIQLQIQKQIVQQYESKKGGGGCLKVIGWLILIGIIISILAKN